MATELPAGDGSLLIAIFDTEDDWRAAHVALAAAGVRPDHITRIEDLGRSPAAGTTLSGARQLPEDARRHGRQYAAAGRLLLAVTVPKTDAAFSLREQVEWAGGYDARIFALQTATPSAFVSPLSAGFDATAGGTTAEVAAPPVPRPGTPPATPPATRPPDARAAPPATRPAAQPPAAPVVRRTTQPLPAERGAAGTPPVATRGFDPVASRHRDRDLASAQPSIDLGPLGTDTEYRSGGEGPRGAAADGTLLV
ncbi:MAG TPA: hypothetical protein VM536_14345 [Chloroflexia bacterium]|nr:hypothetical protein [Chloroflexia bacterium]